MSDTKRSRGTTNRSANRPRRNAKEFGKNILPTDRGKQDRVDPPHNISLEDEEPEPLSLAEEIAEESEQSVDTCDRYEKVKQGEIHIDELQ